MLYQCVNCGASGETPYGSKKFCSNECNYAFYRNHPRPRNEDKKKCPICCETIREPMAANQIYCSAQCQRANQMTLQLQRRKKKNKPPCIICGADMSHARGKKEVCSAVCKKEKIRRMQYRGEWEINLKKTVVIAPRQYLPSWED